MDTLEENKLIAEFMGGKNIGKIGFANGDHFDLPDKPYQKWTNVCGGSYEETTWYHESELLYNSSWDWLMPVVEKIKNDKKYHLLLPAGGLQESISPYINKVQPINRALLSLDIEKLYIAVLGFIEWYNRHQPVKK